MIITKEDHCTGCGTCAKVCPVNCINLDYNEEGFIVPTVDDDRCIKCNRCVRACPGNCDEKKNKKPIHAYGIKHKNDKIVKDSSSGGAFYELSRTIFEKLGCVVAASMNDNFKVKHILINSFDDIQKVTGTKYLQSDISEVMNEIKEIAEKKMVLFVGTPCQVAAIQSFLGKEYENLYYAELICHGVPSNVVFQDTINYLETKKHSKIVAYRFHSKNISWRSNTTYVEFENGKKRDYYYSDNPFMYGYYKNSF